MHWDMNTVTAVDYTLELRISSSSYQKWYIETYKAPGGDFYKDISPAISLKELLRSTIESRLTYKVDEHH